MACDLDSVSELPAPIYFIKKFNNYERLLRIIKNDLNLNGLNKNIVTALYSNDTSQADDLIKLLPTHRIRLNSGTHSISMFLDHQDVNILDFLIGALRIENAEF